MYQFVRAGERTNEKYCITCEKNNFIGIMSDEVDADGTSVVYTLSKHGRPDIDIPYYVDARDFDEYTPSGKEINEWLRYTEENDKQTFDILKETTMWQNEKQLLPEINIDDMF